MGAWLFLTGFIMGFLLCLHLERQAEREHTEQYNNGQYD